MSKTEGARVSERVSWGHAIPFMEMLPQDIQFCLLTPSSGCAGTRYGWIFELKFFNVCQPYRLITCPRQGEKALLLFRGDGAPASFHGHFGVSEGNFLVKRVSYVTILNHNGKN